MNRAVKLSALLAGNPKASRQSALFALVNLGLIESMANGVLSASGAVQIFDNAENCLYVRRNRLDKNADRIMSHGVQLPDLFTVLPAEEAHREFHHELAAMRTLCLKVLDKTRLVA